MRYGRGTASDGMTKYHYAAARGGLAGVPAAAAAGRRGAGGVRRGHPHLPARLGQPQPHQDVRPRDGRADPARPRPSLEPICHSLAEKIPRRGLVCLVSDLFMDVDGLMRGLQHFRHYDHEVMVLHVMDEDELTFPFQGNTMFRGLEADRPADRRAAGLAARVSRGGRPILPRGEAQVRRQPDGLQADLARPTTWTRRCWLPGGASGGGEEGFQQTVIVRYGLCDAGNQFRDALDRLGRPGGGYGADHHPSAQPSALPADGLGGHAVPPGKPAPQPPPAEAGGDPDPGDAVPADPADRSGRRPAAVVAGGAAVLCGR